MGPHRHVSYRNPAVQPLPQIDLQLRAKRRVKTLMERLSEFGSTAGTTFPQLRSTPVDGQLWLNSLPLHVTLDAMKADPALLEAALVGYQSRLTQINQAISEIRRRLSQKDETAETPVKRTRRKMSRAARKRIAAAQKKRWADYKKSKGAS